MEEEVVKLGSVKNHGFDDTSHERRERFEAVVECDTCGKDVLLCSEMQEWHRKNGQWAHAQYGPAQGVCCHNMYIMLFEGCFRYKLEHLS